MPSMELVRSVLEWARDSAAEHKGNPDVLTLSHTDVVLYACIEWCRDMGYLDVLDVSSHSYSYKRFLVRSITTRGREKLRELEA